VVGTVAGLAVVAVFMPRDWIGLAHKGLGFGPFPDGPVAEYLARSTAWFYVLAGVVQWWLSLDVRRYGRAIVALGVIMLASGMVLLWVDIRVGMPPWWTIGDGPLAVALGAVYLVLQFRSRVEVYQAAEAEGREPAEPSAEASEEAPEGATELSEEGTQGAEGAEGTEEPESPRPWNDGPAAAAEDDSPPAV
jgi:hypothetical protein